MQKLPEVINHLKNVCEKKMYVIKNQYWVIPHAMIIVHKIKPDNIKSSY